MHSIKKIAEVLVVVMIVAGFSVFAFQNAQQVALHFMGKTSPELPVFMLLLLSFVVGIVVAALLSLAEILKLNSRLRKQEKLTQALEKQLTLIKQQPLLEDFNPRLDRLQPEAEEPIPRDNDDDDDDISENRQFYPRIR